MNEKEILRVYNRGLKYAERRKSYLETHQEPEDFASYCVEQKLRGKHKKYSWAFVDYLRGNGPRKGHVRYDHAKNLKRATSLNALLSDGATEPIERLYVESSETDLINTQELNFVKRHLRTQDKRSREIFTRILAGEVKKEIAESLDISVSRLSQIVQKTVLSIKDQIKKGEEFLNNSTLSNAERGVYEELIKGKSNQDIADSLYVSEKTVKFHCTNIFKKLGVSSRQELMAKHFGVNLEETKIVSTNNNNNLPMNNNQQNQMQKDDHKESINFIHDKFGVGNTVNMLQHMMKEVTKDGINANNVNAACNCVARLNETIDTAIKASRFLRNG